MYIVRGKIIYRGVIFNLIEDIRKQGANLHKYCTMIMMPVLFLIKVHFLNILPDCRGKEV